ncbi:capsular biosynthesis protein [Pseudomaricurvus alcaniphilus]|uniref:capsule biosynthesis protein n=1 Tax=Pseudomaricurvus alcaniphilus TaxID=1166482 RepID=UPI0014084912|nr:capsular biosynthesis protein [Pseudomaricurvus alcaniphilus]NHN37628.1 capsular biosynthesis protein [Pseudomaricurvus alcaniphilus]
MSPLYRLLGLELRRRGCPVSRINLSFGDWLHWHGQGCYSYRGSRAKWRGYLQRVIREQRITTLVLHGDCRWYHRQAIDVARALDLEVIVTELGALRPGWLTLEWGGLSLNSFFPASAEQICVQAQGLDAPAGQRFDYPFWKMALYDVSYNLLNYFLCFLYPFFRRHTPHNPVIEYLSWIPRLGSEQRRNAAAQQLSRRLAAEHTDYFLFPLQLNGDFQIRVHSPFHSLHQAIDLVLHSFARCAPAVSRLVLKQHPLDCGLDGLQQYARAVAARLGISERLDYIDGGDLGELLRHTRGVVTVNSTVGIEALQAGKPVKVLGGAFYDMAKITSQDSLDNFWSAPTAPQPDCVDALLRLLVQQTQVPGALYGAAGLQSAVDNMAAAILARPYTPLSALGTPPRQAY